MALASRLTPNHAPGRLPDSENQSRSVLTGLSMSRTADFLSDQGLRIDGRKPQEIRSTTCRLGVFEQADGSAYMEMGNTRVLAAVYGPHEVRGGGKSRSNHEKAIINCQYSMATFSTSERKRRPRGDYRSLEITNSMKQVFETAILVHLYPHSQIDIFVEVLQSDGSNYSACVNAASLALVHAGIALKDIVSASTAGIMNETAILDVNHSEEGLSSCPVMTVAILPQTKQVLSLESSGRLNMDSLEYLMEAANKGCMDIYQELKSAVVAYSSRATE